MRVRSTTPVLIGFIGILTIGAWIGSTMAATSLSKPSEEIMFETNTDENSIA